MSASARLVKPSIEYEKSYREGLAELLADPNRKMSTHSDFLVDEETFSEYLKRLEDYERGENLPFQAWVSETILWLVDGNEWIGKISIRHRLTQYLKNFGGNIGYEIRPSKRRQGYGYTILNLGKSAAKDLGIQDIVVTCNATNIGSKKIIEKNGGVFLNEVLEPKENLVKRRYSLQASAE